MANSSVWSGHGMYPSEIRMHNLRYLRNGKNLKIYGKRNLRISRSHYSERASALDFKDTSAARFGHSDVVFDLFLETCFLHLIALLSNFCKLFWLFRYHFTNMAWLHVKNTTNPFIKHFCWWLKGDMFWCLLQKIHKNYITMTKSWSGGVFEV